jgi:precorrin-2 dehydrogenase/sirohydrochlorin ferrochelatase
MHYYPVLVDLNGKRVLVVGGGSVAERKVNALIGFGASVDVVSKELSPDLLGKESQGLIRWVGREFDRNFLNGVVLAIAATDDSEVNRDISKAATEKGILVNAVDQPEDCSFIVPAVIQRGDLLIAISTSGKSPAFAKKIRKDLEKRFGPEYGDFLSLMGRVRKQVLQQGLPHDMNKETFGRLVDSRLLEIIKDRDWESASTVLSKILGVVWSASDIREAVNGTAAD